MKIADVKVGDELFRYVFPKGVFRYVVIGRREYAEGVQLEVECKTCSHGWQCQLLLAQDDYDHIVAVHMLNNDEEDDQRHWHANESGLHFCATAEEAKQEQVKKLVRDAEDGVRKAKEALRAAEARLAEMKGLMEGVQP